ncbi:MAG: 16S rRNA (guanine(527)-N(7))-methyltransferase RsmG [Bacteroidetes bacterium]|nr:16S rRNA (guanine(527)-N(7))-methyltransferase RsmG [Bacteroidota bacterium]
MDHIIKYFPNLDPKQMSQLKMVGPQYRFWNEKVNVISRQDIDNIYEHHVLHSTALAKFIDFLPGTSVMDLGTGGGFPGIPLAILFPEVHFHLVDSIDKKVKVVESIYKALGLRNVSVEHARAEDIREKFDFVVTRAVAYMMILYDWTINLIKRGASFNDYSNGLIMLKGGFLDLEIAPFKEIVYKFPITEWMPEQWFIDKALLYLPMD